MRKRDFYRWGTISARARRVAERMGTMSPVTTPDEAHSAVTTICPWCRGAVERLDLRVAEMRRDAQLWAWVLGTTLLVSCVGAWLAYDARLTAQRIDNRFFETNKEAQHGNDSIGTDQRDE